MVKFSQDIETSDLGYRCEVMPLLPSKVKANCQMGSVDVDVEMSRRKAALVCDYQSKLESQNSF